MLALSRRGDKAFVHQPDRGLAVPIVLDMRANTLNVAVPTTDELEHDYAVYDDLEEMAEAAGQEKWDAIQFAERFSREYTKEFKTQIDAGDITVAGLRKLIATHWHKLNPKFELRSTSVVSDLERAVTAA